VEVLCKPVAYLILGRGLAMLTLLRSGRRRLVYSVMNTIGMNGEPKYSPAFWSFSSYSLPSPFGLFIRFGEINRKLLPISWACKRLPTVWASAWVLQKPTWAK